MGTTFSGADTVLVNMQKIRENMAKNGQRRAVLAGARVIAEAMTERAPILDEKSPGSDSLEPGDIKDNIKARTRQIDGETVGLAGPIGKEGRIPKTAYLVEYGHRMVTGGASKLTAFGTFAGGGKVHEEDIPAFPFLRPGFESSAGEAFDAMAVSLGKTLKEGIK